MTVWISDPPDRPATGTRWHSREDCPAIAGIGSPVRFSDLVKYGIDPAAKCRACDKRDRSARATKGAAS